MSSALPQLPDPDLPFIDVARVEVLRGPQGSLYGAGSIGGILQITPTPPDLDNRGGRITGMVSATAHGDPSRSISAVFNQPVGHGAAVLLHPQHWRGEEDFPPHAHHAERFVARIAGACCAATDVGPGRNARGWRAGLVRSGDSGTGDN